MPSNRSSMKSRPRFGAGSAEKCLETARRVTDLFLASAGSFNDEQVGLFDDVLERLIKTIEIRSLCGYQRANCAR